MIKSHLLYSHKLHMIAVRFVVIGATNSAIYALVTWVMIALCGLSPTLASVIGYLAAIPAAFLGHRHFTFRSSDRWLAEAVRFVFVHLVGISVSVFAMAATMRYLHLSYGWGIVAAVMLVPGVNFVVSYLWVFQGRRRPVETNDIGVTAVPRPRAP